jgi:hypothetical protein
MPKLLIFAGLALLLIGLIVLAAQRFLPGDIVIERDGFTLYIPPHDLNPSQLAAYASLLAARPLPP